MTILKPMACFFVLVLSVAACKSQNSNTSPAKENLQEATDKESSSNFNAAKVRAEAKVDLQKVCDESWAFVKAKLEDLSYLTSLLATPSEFEPNEEELLNQLMSRVIYGVDVLASPDEEKINRNHVNRFLQCALDDVLASENGQKIKVTPANKIKITRLMQQFPYEADLSKSKLLP